MVFLKEYIMFTTCQSLAKGITHIQKKTQERERERENSSWAVQAFKGAGKQFFLQWPDPDFNSPPPFFHPSPLAFLVKLLSLVIIAHPCALSDMNCPGLEASCICASSLLTMNSRTDCQEFLLKLHHLALTVAEKLLTLLEGFGSYCQASWWQVWGMQTDCYTLVFNNHLLWRCSRKKQLELITETDRETLRKKSLGVKVLLELNPDETNQWGICLQLVIVVINIEVKYDIILSFASLVCSETINWNRNTYNVLPILCTQNFKICDNALWYLMVVLAKRMRYWPPQIPLMKCFD